MACAKDGSDARHLQPSGLIKSHWQNGPGVDVLSVPVMLRGSVLMPWPRCAASLDFRTAKGRWSEARRCCCCERPSVLPHISWVGRDGRGGEARTAPKSPFTGPRNIKTTFASLADSCATRAASQNPCATYDYCTTHSSLLNSSPGTTLHILRTMSVLLETSAGDITIDLLVNDAPKCCEK